VAGLGWPADHAAGPDEWDAPRGEARTLREIAEHVSHVHVYAEYVGRFG
jgi:hypothetical protein